MKKRDGDSLRKKLEKIQIYWYYSVLDFFLIF